MTPGSVEPPVLVLGVGNALLGDDGAGLLVLAELERDAEKRGDQVEFLDGGTQGLALLDRIASRRALLVLDAVALGAEPETLPGRFLYVPTTSGVPHLPLRPPLPPSEATSVTSSRSFLSQSANGS